MCKERFDLSPKICHQTFSLKIYQLYINHSFCNHSIHYVWFDAKSPPLSNLKWTLKKIANQIRHVVVVFVCKHEK